MTCGCSSCPFDTSVGTPRKIIYQQHVTVDPRTDISKFKRVCSEVLKVEPIVIENLIHDKWHYDIFTSSNEPLYQRVADGLRLNGFRVLRQKTETVPWNPLVPTRINKKLTRPYQYFEAHLKVSNPNEGMLQYKRLGLLVSKRIDRDIPMFTLRRMSKTIEDFEEELSFIKQKLWVTKAITEFAIFDSNLDYDKEWMNDTN